MDRNRNVINKPMVCTIIKIEDCQSPIRQEDIAVMDIIMRETIAIPVFLAVNLITEKFYLYSDV
jgi:hypothetical protein